MASTRLTVPTEMQNAARTLFEKYRSNECRQQHESMCRPQEAASKYAVGEKVCIRPSENKTIEPWCLVATLAESKCFTAGENRQFRPMVLVRVSSDGSRIIERAGFQEEKPLALRIAPLYSVGSSLLTSSCGMESTVLIEERCWLSSKYRGGPDWAYKVRGQPDKWMPEGVLRPKEEPPKDQTHSEATPQPTAESAANEGTQGSCGAQIFPEEASQKTDRVGDLIAGADTHKPTAAKFDKDKADKLKVQMDDLGIEKTDLEEQMQGYSKERAKLEEKVAILKVQEDVLSQILAALKEKAAKTTEEAEDMEALASTATEASTELSHAAKRRRVE
ncbi:hypothetical protein EDD37DRAFT_646970 [Exophiala viscosa]|uniref:uncharacterized protein n=1 Tax=Exophiala viscosa TaxID=2486360 RepID=UPI00219BDA08|nr:hypothetical protein EDD37DRAFT_646970 [Exophiala viscosa]